LNGILSAIGTRLNGGSVSQVVAAGLLSFGGTFASPFLINSLLTQPGVTAGVVLAAATVAPAWLSYWRITLVETMNSPDALGNTRSPNTSSALIRASVASFFGALTLGAPFPFAAGAAGVSGVVAILIQLALSTGS